MSHKKRDVWGEAELGLGSVGKIRILRTLLNKPNQVFTKYGLEKATGLKPVDVRSNLKTLITIGWVKEYHYEPKTYQINIENNIVQRLSEFFRGIRYS